MGIRLTNNNEKIEKAINELLRELNISDEKIDIELIQDKEFKIEYENNLFKLYYFKENNIYFGFSYILSLILNGKIENCFNKKFDSKIENLTFMIDCSRNSVLKVETVKRLIRLLSLMGYESLMLYTEDTYKVNEYPYFGYLRNPYTKEEIKELDEYSKLFNIELIPCIQTLAHVNSLIRHISMGNLFDINDILLVGSEDTYNFIDALIKSCRESFSSKKIHIGMDEAMMLGRGQYLNIHGYKERFDIMCEHLDRVIKICKKYDFEPMMWSDMFVGIASSNEDELENKKKLVPKDVELIYWDYYSMEEEHYLKYLKIHKKLDNKIGFAGGAWKWLGFTPDNRFSFVSLRESMKAVNKEKIKNYIVTGWGDNGSETSLYAILPSLLYSQYSRYEMYDINEEFKNHFYALFSMKFDDFMTIDLLNRTTRNDDPYERSSANKYLLYNDPLLGTLDTTITKNVKEIYKEHLEKLKKALKVSDKWGYIFKVQVDLAKILTIKAELGVDLRKAYKENDSLELNNLYNDIKTLLSYIDVFKKDFRTEWNMENKSNGIDVFDIRIGALIERLNITLTKLDDYLNKRTNDIPELEEVLLDFLGNGDKFKEDYNQCEYRWRRMTSVNVNE